MEKCSAPKTERLGRRWSRFSDASSNLTDARERSGQLPLLILTDAAVLEIARERQTQAPEK
jgi:hypothetical protein